jgi:catechol 2,3-dioxygenase-like lactoylglutathione lyase family enzyme
MTATRRPYGLWLSGPRTSAARPMPDGRQPGPGGWNRLVLEVEDLPARVAQMPPADVRFRLQSCRVYEGHPLPDEQAGPAPACRGPGAPDEVRRDIQNMPDQEFGSVVDVMKAFGAEK